MLAVDKLSDKGRKSLPTPSEAEAWGLCAKLKTLGNEGKCQAEARGFCDLAVELLPTPATVFLRRAPPSLSPQFHFNQHQHQIQIQHSHFVFEQPTTAAPPGASGGAHFSIPKAEEQLQALSNVGFG
ncbi:hypothetical protein L1987_23450 [Smallanthus sonchifolius]|uniref:Uncharacterized protein n=1 Tax=Smallanthus sonchifolius TaxID=185202 RepID=A0ACB9IJ51_9ASTR|nr:hypothetical protein L1987_23450 [Smallanthus sonchifolius]